ncbi:MAG: hypothetical protein LBQ50_03640 [Planctomycetaceae bacterium]|nr:hypothetical protein [Planctomycetaceae bacterium]
MTRAKSSSQPPKMGNNGGTAFVRIHGQRIYLGKYGSEEAKQNYARYVAEWAAWHRNPTQSVGKVTLDTLSVAFLDYAQKRYGSSDYSNYRTAIRVLLELYSGMSIENFGIQTMLGNCLFCFLMFRTKAQRRRRF